MGNRTQLPFYMNGEKLWLSTPALTCAKLLITFKILLYLCACVSVHTCAHAHGSQKGVSGLLELELQAVLSHYMHGGN